MQGWLVAWRSDNLIDLWKNNAPSGHPVLWSLLIYFSKNITGTPSYELFSKGILRTFQIAHEFTNLTVLENLMMVPGNQSGENLINAFLKPTLIKKEEDLIRKAREAEREKEVLRN